MQPFEQLEHDWAAFNGLSPAGMVACASGSAALHLALEAMRLPPGSEVVTGDYNMIAVARAIALAGLTPVFVDCRDDLLVDRELVVGVQDGAGAVIYTHVYGRRCNMEGYARQPGVGSGLRPGEHYIVEDLAEAHGVRPHHLTDAACWSFYKNKIVAGEEGGAVWFRDPEHAARARRLRSLGFTEAHDYVHEPRGMNYRMSNLHARFILDDFGQGPHNSNALRYARPFTTWAPQRDHPGNLAWRREIEGWYDAACPAEWRMPARDAVWIFDVRVPGLTRAKQAEVVRTLNAVGVAARMGFWPMSLQKEFDGCRRVREFPARSAWTNAETAAAEVFYLPVQPGRTTEADCRRAFQILTEALPRSR